jgi:hypothetical protein
MEAAGYWLSDIGMSQSLARSPDGAQAEISIGHTDVIIPDAVPREIIDRAFTIKKTGKAIANGIGAARSIPTPGSPPHSVSKRG